MNMNIFADLHTMISKLSLIIDCKIVFPPFVGAAGGSGVWMT